MTDPCADRLSSLESRALELERRVRDLERAANRPSDCREGRIMGQLIERKPIDYRIVWRHALMLMRGGL